MARGIRAESLALALALALAAAGSAGAAILVHYGFDDDRIETGPDTFAVFEKARGRVTLASAYRFSGYRSLEIVEVSGDGDFPELQGYFRVRREGQLYVHFAFLVVDPREELNIALAGPACFRLAKDGIAFWLTTRDGMLAHVSDSITRKLFPLEAFTWYRVDLAYDIDRGTYDLAVSEEQQLEQRVHLLDQPNATSQPGSAVDKFSFIGDLRDRSNVRYYVDDVVVGSDRSVAELPFVAPGRRKLFFDVYLEAQERLRERTGCPPAMRAQDFGLTPETARRVLAGRAAAVAVLRGLEPADGAPPQASDGPGAEVLRLVRAAALWRSGCRALEGGAAAEALGHFEAAGELAPGAPLYPVSAALALAAAGRHREADARWRRVEGAWSADPRYPVIMALLGRARGDLEEAERWLRAPAEEAAHEPGPPSPAQEGAAALYFYTLLWTDRLGEAERYADALARRLEAAGQPAGAWLERAGDAAVHLDALGRAIERYERALREEPQRASVLLKLSDLHFARGDLARERAYRERIYGTLRERPAKEP